LNIEASEIGSVVFQYLSIPWGPCTSLFYDFPDHINNLDDVLALAAIDTLKRLAETGPLEWRI
jgi:hypothetical protein